MRKENENFGYKFLIGILFAVICFLVYYIFVGRNMNKNDINYEKISQSEVEGIVNDELFIFFKRNVKSLSDVTNDDKLYVVFNGLKKKSDDVLYSKDEVDKFFLGSSINKLGIVHGQFDIYTFDGEFYRMIDSDALSNMIYNYVFPIARKVVAFSNNNGKYTISYNYIFPDDVPPHFGYGSISDMFNESNSVVTIMTDEKSGDIIDVEKYLDENYNNIKDRLSTYNYVFVKENGKISIVDFYIN